MALKVRTWALSALLASLPVSVIGCSSPTEDASNPLVTDVQHTDVKRQSIGNCWLYAQATWLESELLAGTGQNLDVSESYWTWWHWYDQIVGRNISEVSTGGFWQTSANIILKHGFVLESEFITNETGAEMSLQQSYALRYINAQLAPGGALDTRAKRTAARVRKELDKAFSEDTNPGDQVPGVTVHMRNAERHARSAAATVIDTAAGTTLAQALGGDAAHKWVSVSFPRLFGQSAEPGAANAAQRKALLRRVEKALNDHQPVVMSLMIDFNALDTTDATFKKSLVDQGRPGRQGGHMVVLEDYTVENAPGFGTIGEGEVSDEMKQAALDGDLVLLKAKNSWGKNRSDRGLTDGYTRFDRDYLTGQMGWYANGEEQTGPLSYYTTLTGFVLPPGY
jgi:hypothetical protein